MNKDLKKRITVHILMIWIMLLVYSLPVLAVEDKDVEAEGILAKAALLAEIETDTILYQQNVHERLFPASTTKIMTALLVVEAIAEGQIGLRDEITASAAAVDIPADGSTMRIPVEAGEIMTVEEHLYAAMLQSDCISCNVLAEYVSGSIEAFVAQMNVRAAELGCADTHFTNTTGYPDEDHYTTAWSLYLITREAVKSTLFVRIVDTVDYHMPATNINEERVLHNTNWLLGMPEFEEENPYDQDYYYPYARGVKTGRTNDAGNCLVAFASKDDLTTVSVILGAENIKLEDQKIRRQSFTETTRLFQWGFLHFAWVPMVDPESDIRMPVAGAGEVDSVKLQAAEIPTVLIRTDQESQEFSYEISLYYEWAAAPINRGDILGEVEIFRDEELIAAIPLMAAESVAAKETEPDPEEAADSGEEAGKSREDGRDGTWQWGIILPVILCGVAATELLVVFVHMKKNKYGKYQNKRK